MNRYTQLLVFSFLVLFGNWISATLQYVNFDTAMRVDEFRLMLIADTTKQRVGMDAELVYDFFRCLYEQNSFLKIQPQQRVKIPKIIHQIWIGKEVPRELRDFQESWRKHHPDWEYKLWTQHDLPHLNLQNQKYIDKTRNPGEQSDLMRYEILYRYGGVYIDMDFECLQPLDSLNYLYDFYIGIQPLDCGFVQLGIGLIGAAPGHSILKRCMERSAELWENFNSENIPERTGPILCTKVFMDRAGKDGTVDIALPSHYFYPLGCEEFDLKKDDWCDRGAFAVHHWAKTWLKASFRRPEFQKIKNY